MLRLEGKFIEDKLIIGAIEEAEFKEAVEMAVEILENKGFINVTNKNYNEVSIYEDDKVYP